MKKLLVANYKMNGDKNFYMQVNKVINKTRLEDTIVLCPPFVYMPFFKIKNKNVILGSQDISSIENKKSTGQTNAKMLNEFGVKYTLIGHSERRELYETNEIVAEKVKYAQENGIVPIVCVGEKDKSSSLDVLIEQVKIVLNQAQSKELVFAYEPIWAIGSGEIPTINQIEKAILLIKNTAKECGFNVKVLYGGSVNYSNYQEILTENVDGLLMGGVSLKIDDFMKIVKGE